jgi:hypothetical protein
MLITHKNKIEKLHSKSALLCLHSAQERNADIIALKAGGIVSHAVRVICCVHSLCSIHIRRSARFFLCYLLFMPYRTSERAHVFKPVAIISAAFVFFKWSSLLGAWMGLVTLKFSFNSQTGTLSLEIKNKKLALGASWCTHKPPSGKSPSLCCVGQL